MKRVLFVTGNRSKVVQAQQCLDNYHIQVQSRDVDVDEIQSHNPTDITLAKATAAFKALNKALVVCDHSWSFPALKGFPGGYMKDINKWFEPEDFLSLMSSKKDRSVILTETIVYIDEKSNKIFQQDYKGRVSAEPRGVGNVACERVVIYDGENRTIAETHDAGDHSTYLKDSAWHKFGKWYAEISDMETTNRKKRPL